MFILLWLLLNRNNMVVADFTVGSTVIRGNPWISPAKTFGFGFVTPASSGSQGYNLAIWYDIDPNKTVVWTAMTNGELLQVSASAKVELRAEGGITVTQGSSSIPLWQTNPGQCCAERASLLENGNLVVIGSNKQVAWQSFDSPTNTILPEQQFRTQGTAILGYTRLISQSGAYQLVLNSGQVLLKNLRQEIPQRYWSISNPNINSSMTCLDDITGEHVLNNNACQPDPSLKFPAVFNMSSQGVISFYDATGKAWKSGETASTDSALDYNQGNALRRLTLDNDGNLRIYSFNSVTTSKNASWRVVWQAVFQGCDIFGACGAFALCTYRPRKTCSCPPGFHRVDPNDESKGCDYNVPLGACENSQTSGMKLVRVNRADYYFNDYSFDSSIRSLQQCKDTCMQDCKCLAAAYKYDGSGVCYLKGGSNKLYNGKQTFSDINIIFMKLSTLDAFAVDDHHDPFLTDANATLNDQLRPKTSKRVVYLSRNLQSIVVSLAVAELLLFGAGAVVVNHLWQRNSRKKWEEISAEIEGLPTKFTYHQLQDATSNFSELLGTGGFGSVFKGNIPEKGGVVAVKVIKSANRAETQFKAEVTTIGRVHHVNLVRLLGYCAQGDHHLLVYEFMPNGSLDKHISDPSATFSKWETRYSIALGVAKGITYLHEKCSDCIVHCDIKPQNVLLDENFSPKIADFGLARWMRKESMSVTTVRGTRGYLAPEWLEGQSITPKADVYSFGMLLLDVLGGERKNTVVVDKESEITVVAAPAEWYFPIYAFHKYMASELESIADPNLEIASAREWEEFETLLKVALLCIHRDPRWRPVMSRVVQMMEGNAEVSVPPFPDAEESILYVAQPTE